MPFIAEFAARATLAEIIGVVGFGLYVLNYSLLTLRRLTNSNVSYYMLNIAAATCVLIGLAAHFNLAAAMVQIFWIAMSLLGIALRLSERARLEPRRDPAHGGDTVGIGRMGAQEPVAGIG